MPKIRSKRKKTPKGWDKISTELEKLQEEMKEVENEEHEGKRKPETLWPIYRIHH